MTASTVNTVLHAEWIKSRTLPSTFWQLAGAIVATVAISAGVAAGTKCGSASCGYDPAKTSLTGVYLGQAVFAGLAVVAIGNEYSTRMITSTFAAMPRRTGVLAAKAAIIAGLVLAAGLVAVAGSMLAAQLVLPGNGFTAGHGYLAVSLSSGPMLRAGFGTVLYLALVGLLGLGVATAVRDSAVAIGLVLSVLFVIPIAATFVGNHAVQRHLEQIAPMSAGLAIEDTVNVASQPIGPWAGLGVLAAWAAGALLLGWLVLIRRDA